MIRKTTDKNISNLLSLFQEFKKKRKTIMEIDGSIVKMMSDRYDCFLKSIECSSCKSKGIFFAMERHESNNGRFHWNLYTIKEGKEVLMTKDHIKPKSKGGKNHISNYQTMCVDCNIEKGDNY